MRRFGALALALGLTACATVPPSEPEACQPRQSHQRGLRDGQQGSAPNTSYLKGCGPAREMAYQEYKEGYEVGRSQASSSRRDEVLSVPRPASLPSTSWVCEVEASTKIFTGVGASEAEAKKAARDTCGAHFQSSYCTQTDCRTSL